ncbi:MAG: glycosyltransferase family 2 protein [Verrucomicrobia bacterium]|nr:glycosyltransferase family 2 protein [Verrucomicrobiota bacterium]MBI3870106.1 glycosyltransferase family 2 protein [Verrucomicrobiota bacterium]
MSSPAFSVVIPTKGRGFLVGQAVRSVLDQSFTDWELIVADNDDAEDTRRVMEGFSDPRVRYLRTGGLSMTDNWEAAAKDARGGYLCVIEDKQLLKPFALQLVKQEAERTGAAIIRWQADTFDDEQRPARIRRAPGAGPALFRNSDDLLAQFTRSILGYKETLPLPQLSAFHRPLLQKVRGGPVGRLFPEVSPDISMGLIALAAEDRVLDMRRSLVVYASSFHSNGRASHRKEASSRDFFKRLSGGEAMCYDHVPIKVLCTPSGVFNDFLRLRGRLQGRLAACAIDWTHYFVECHGAMTGVARSGVDMSKELSDWRRALEEQPQEIRAAVVAILGREDRREPSPVSRAIKRLGRGLGLPALQRYAKHWIRGKLQRDPEWRFSTPAEYMEWERRRHPSLG